MESFPLIYLCSVSTAIALKVHENVPIPFIDERFHLRQCATYCALKFSEWDNKITTPPGLYLLGFIYSKLLEFLGIENNCGVTALRSLNFIGGTIILPLILSFLATNNYWKVNIVSLPLLYTYYFLFYTDVWSTIFVIAGVVAVIRLPNFKGAVICNLLGFLGLWFRQTNILWIAMCAVILVEQRTRPSLTYYGQLKQFSLQSFRDIGLLIPFATNALLFVAFVKYNGGITFGDKENHQMSLHLVQVFYCWTFVGGLTLPIWLSRKTLNDYWNFSVGRYGLKLIVTLLGYFAIFYIVKNFTIVHPFLLADNRHYTFYIYRRILSKPYSQYFVVPVFHFFQWLIPYMLSQTPSTSSVKLSNVGIIAFLAITSLTIIPSPLFEPRYYIVPLILFRLFSKLQLTSYGVRNHLYEFVWYLFINGVIFIVFFNFKFTWLSETGFQRIIW